jgi:NADH-quinone oxidoreductase subunit J
VEPNPSGIIDGIPLTNSAKSFGYSLFTKYMLPFQVTGFLLLAAMLGVIVISKKSREEIQAQIALEGGGGKL